MRCASDGANAILCPDLLRPVRVTSRNQILRRHSDSIIAIRLLAIWCASSSFGAVKKIEAVIKPFKAEPVKEALIAAGVERMSLYEGKRICRQKGDKRI